MRASDDMRVLVVAPLGRDAELIVAALDQASVPSQVFGDVVSAVENFRRSAGGALLVAEEALGSKAINVLSATLEAQPVWSDVPVLVLTGWNKYKDTNQQSERPYLELGKITLLERPMQMATLISSVKAALRARSRQYERRLAEEALRKSDKLAIVGRLASSIAHEINNPLEAIMNALYLLGSTSLDKKQRDYLNIARRELTRVSEIATHTLTFNRQSNLRTQASISEILDSVLTLYHVRLTNSNIKIERQFEGGEQLICYPGELRQVFANLIGNAFDATRNGGRIVVRERPLVHPGTGQHGIRVTVADTGCGISPDIRAHLFEAFNSDKGIHGTGLGLWVSRGIIDKHCGLIRVRSSTRQGHSGTVFSIFIPRDPRSAVAENPQSTVLRATGTE